MYHEGCRTIDKYILNTLTPLGLFIWFIDDGSFYQDNRGNSRGIQLRIHSNAYSYSDHLLMMKFLNDKFGLRFNLRQNFKKERMRVYYELYLKAIDRLKFYDEILAPNLKYLPQDLEYKIPKRETIVSLMETPNNRKASMKELSIKI